MESNFKTYNYMASFQRIQDILNQSDVNYEESDSLPDRTKLTYSNGYYSRCSAMFVDIRESSKLPEKYRRPTLARIYRAYISEVVAVMTGNLKCHEVNIVGDGAWAVFDTPYKSDIDEVFGTACRINSLLQVLNCKMAAKGYEGIRVGIGMSWGRALVIKAGYSGSGISDVVYMGEVVNEAAKLAAKGRLTVWTKPQMMSGNFHTNLSEHNQGLCSWNGNNSCYESNAVNTAMNDWYAENCT